MDHNALLDHVSALPPGPAGWRGACSVGWGLAVRTPLRVLRRGVYGCTGRWPPGDSADRQLLEQCILPHYRRRADVRDVLFVGTCRLSRHYHMLLDAERQRCTTIDLNPRAARYGSPNRHIIGCITGLHRHVAPASLDLIVFNGVYGWGLNNAVDMQRTLLGFHAALRPGGELLIGWNDIPGRRPFVLGSVPALALFKRAVFAPLGVSALTLDTDNRHRYEFYRKPRTPGAAIAAKSD